MAQKVVPSLRDLLRKFFGKNHLYITDLANKKYLTTQELCLFLNRSASKIAKIKEGDSWKEGIHYKMHEGQRWYNKEAIEDWIWTDE